MKKLAVGTSANFINDRWFEINEDRARDVFAGASFREKSVEGIVSTPNGFVRRHLTIRLDAVFEAEQFPASIAYL
jgi:hypothetical protein